MDFKRDDIRNLNKKCTITLVCCTFILSLMILLNAIGIFQFEQRLVIVILTFGFFVSLSPGVLYLLKVPDTFQKYYNALMLAVLIGAMGCFQGIGIYITYILVPVASVLYFDRRFTIQCVGISYVVMLISIYINAGSSHAEHGKTQFEHFSALSMGYTLEYIVTVLFLLQILKRSRFMLERQHQADIQMKSQDLRYQLLIKGTRDLIFEYDFQTKLFQSNRSLYQENEVQNQPVLPTDFDELLLKVPQLITLKERWKEKILEEDSDGFWLEVPEDEKTKTPHRWFWCEFFLVKDANELVAVIGKLHDETQRKMAELQKQRTSELSENVRNKRRSLFERALEASGSLTEADYQLLAQGHRFVGSLLDHFKYSEEPTKAVDQALQMVGENLHLDRILVMSIDSSAGMFEASYGWDSKNDDSWRNFRVMLTPEEIDYCTMLYDQFGYLEYNPGIPMRNTRIEISLRDKIFAVSPPLGSQIMIPALEDGQYTGVIIFDKYDTSEYTTAQRFLFSEIVTTLSANIMKLNAIAASHAKSDFLSTMSHEIRTPMNAIIGMSEVALREEMSPTVRKCLKTVQSSSYGLLTLVNDILDFSKIEAGKIEIVPERFHIFSLINDVKEILQARNNGKLDFIMDIPENLPSYIYADMVRIKQVMINFGTNAIKYTDEGYVKLSVSVEQGSDGAKLYYKVKDSGIGIRKEDLSRLFRSYEQVDVGKNHHKEGTGLGLAISKQLIDLMQGQVMVESEYGLGSEFSFVLPIEIKDATPAGKLAAFRYEDEENIQAKKHQLLQAPEARVLIVDDTEVNLMVAEALLGPTDMQIDTAISGEQALSMLEHIKYDLIFMDQFMPQMDGVECTHRIRAMEGNQNQHIPIIALTADAVDGVREKLLNEGMDDFLTKPIMVDVANRILMEWLPKEKIQG